MYHFHSKFFSLSDLIFAITLEASLNGALADDGTKLSSQLTAFKALFKTTASFQQELLASTSGLRSFLVAANHLAPICSVVVGEEDASGNVSVTLTVKASSISSYAVSKINSDLASIIISSGSLISHLDTAQVAALQQQASTLIGTDALYSSIGDLSSTMPSIVLSLPKTAALAMVLTQSDGEGDVTLTNTAAGNYDIDFNSQNLSSGIYFYKLRIGKNELVKKMLLLR